MQLMIPAESAHDTIGALGEVGLLQFKDLNADKSAFQRTYANQVRYFAQQSTGCLDKRQGGSCVQRNEPDHLSVVAFLCR